jgi:hypothetical protein
MDQAVSAGLTEVRHTLIYGALKAADDYCLTFGIIDPVRARFVATVTVDEALAYWNARPLDAPAHVVATDSLNRLTNTSFVGKLLDEHGFAP